MATKKNCLSIDFILKRFSPGTSLRNALNDLLRARIGALIVIEKKGLSKIVRGGFKINSKFTPQRLVELAKMDGAIILSEDLRRIIRSNSLLYPSIKIPSNETGTRHQAAERTAKQLGAIVIAVSERKNKVTIYFGDKKHELENTSEILRRATETLQSLEKQKEIFDDSLINFNILEINNLVSKSDVCDVLKRIEIIRRISDIIKNYLFELGKEGVIVSMRLKELTQNILYEREMILKDYFIENYSEIDSLLCNMNFDFLIETSNLSRLLFVDENNDKIIESKGFRLINKTGFLESNINLLLSNFKNLQVLFNSDKSDFLGIFKNENFVDSLMENIDNLKDKIMSGKKI
jgi:diadenylate cyclase